MLPEPENKFTVMPMPESQPTISPEGQLVHLQAFETTRRRIVALAALQGCTTPEYLDRIIPRVGELK